MKEKKQTSLSRFIFFRYRKRRETSSGEIHFHHLIGRAWRLLDAKDLGELDLLKCHPGHQVTVLILQIPPPLFFLS